ncbi:MAG: hypothetical protein JXA73_22780 [Acidobacteria bacterium]|nr:hypothetical protein [Acidobacteriota bacterium]
MQFKEGDVEERDVLEQIQRWAEDEKSLTTVAVCLDGDSKAFSTALAISSKLASTPTPIWVRLSDETGLASLTTGRTDVGAWMRIPLDVVGPFHLKLSGHSIRSCQPNPVEVVIDSVLKLSDFGVLPGMLDNIPEQWTRSRNAGQHPGIHPQRC